MFNIQPSPGPSHTSHPLGGPFPPGGAPASAAGELHGSGQVSSPEEGYQDEDRISLHPRESEAGSGNSERSSRARLREVETEDSEDMRPEEKSLKKVLKVLPDVLSGRHACQA